MPDLKTKPKTLSDILRELVAEHDARRKLQYNVAAPPTQSTGSNYLNPAMFQDRQNVPLYEPPPSPQGVVSPLSPPTISGGKTIWEHYRTGETITQAEKDRRYPKGYEAGLDEWRLTVEAAKQYPAVFKVFGEALTKVPKQTGAAILQAVQGQGGASVVDRDWADRFIQSASTDIEEFSKRASEMQGALDLPINLTDIAQLPQNIGFSMTSMGVGLATGVPISLIPLPGARVAAWTAGTIASGAVAYRMTTYQIMQQYLELKNDEKITRTGKGLTQAEEDQLKKGFESSARKYGLWEAVPEAISNLAFAKILTAPLSKMIGRSIAVKILGKVAGMYGQELLTETITQKGQSKIEVEAGLREGTINWWEAFKEVAPQTFLLTTILGGSGQVAVGSYNKIKKSLQNETEAGTLQATILEKLKEIVNEETGAITLPGGEGVTGDIIKATTRTVNVTEELSLKKTRLAGASQIEQSFLRMEIKDLETALSQGKQTYLMTDSPPKGFNLVEIGKDKYFVREGVSSQTVLEKIKSGEVPTTQPTVPPEVTPTIPKAEAGMPERELVPEIKKPFVEKPLPTMPTPKKVTYTPTGDVSLTPVQVTKTLEIFGKYVEGQSVIDAWELTRELRRETRAGQAEILKARAQELIIEQGLDAESGMKQAVQEALSGELPTSTTDYLSDLTNNMRAVLFNRVYEKLKDDPFEMASTITALTNALNGRAIPRDPGVKGGSAYTRLQRVFGDQPVVLKALEKISTEKETLEDVVEGIYHETGRDPIPIDEAMAEYLRGLSTDVLYTPTAFREPIPVTEFEAPIEDAIKQLPLLPRPASESIVRALKEIGMSPIDIGNFLRANKASFDFSFWRQQAPLIASHPVSFVQANIEAWHALWSQESAEASWDRITKDPIYQIYLEAAEKGGDFLRPLILAPGAAQYRGTEEFGYTKGVNRLIPKLTAKLPWVKLSARAFETGTNVHNWLIFKSYYKAMLKISEQYATGQKKFKSGESFDVVQEMVDFSKSLANFSARGSLGKFSVAAPELSALFFAPRATLGRILSIKDLVNANPRVRKEAWKNTASFVSTFGGLVLLGAMMGWWEVEKDPRNAEYMSIRIGTTRIDPWGGYRQLLVFFSRAVTQTGVSSVTGAEYKADPLNLIQTFIRGKASPLASLILDFWRGKNFIGEDVDVKNKRQWVERIAPFSLWDIYEAYTDDPATGLGIVIPAMVGAGVQTYPSYSKDFEEYNKIPSNELELEAAILKKTVKYSRSEYRERNPEIDAKLFISGQVTTVKTPKAAQEVLRLVQEEKIKPSEISAVKAWQKEDEKRKELGLRDTNVTLTDDLIKKLLSPQVGNVPAREVPVRRAPTGNTVPSSPSSSWSELTKEILEQSRRNR